MEDADYYERTPLEEMELDPPVVDRPANELGKLTLRHGLDAAGVGDEQVPADDRAEQGEEDDHEPAALGGKVPVKRMTGGSPGAIVQAVGTEEGLLGHEGFGRPRFNRQGFNRPRDF